MIASLRLFLGLRVRLVRNALRHSLRRGLGEVLPAWAELAVPLLVGLLSLPISLGLGVLAFLWGRILAEGGQVAAPALLACRLLLGVALGLTLFTPNWSAGGLDPGARTRLSLLPVRRRTLCLLEVAGSLANPWILGWAPALLLLPVGLLVGGSPGAALLVLSGSAAFFLVLCLAGAAAGLAAELLLRRRAVAETLLLVLLTGVLFVGFLPRLMGGADARIPPSEGLTFPWALAWVPSEGFASLLLHAVRASEVAGPGEEILRAGLRLAGLASTILLLALLTRGLWERTMAAPGGLRSRGRGRGAGFRWSRRLPLRSSALPVRQVVDLAEAEWRSLRRSLRGRVALLFPPLTTLALALSLRVPLPPGSEAVFPLLASALIRVELAPTVALFGVLMSLLMASSLMNNQFAVEGPALELLTLQPLSWKRIVAAKALVHGLFFAVAALLSAGVAALVLGGGSLASWMALPFQALAAFGFYLPLTVVLSTLFARPADPTRLGRAGNAHPAAELAAAVGGGLSLLPGALLLGRGIGSPVAVVVLGAMLAASALALGGFLAGRAADHARSRRQGLLEAAAGRG